MVVIEIISTGEFLEISNTDITYTKQVADFGDITTAVASHSWNLKTPKTPHNTKILENLGIVGDTSTVPYRKIYVRLLDGGVPIVESGLLIVKETANDYKTHIQEGIVDFYRDVADDKIGEAINLRELNHENDLQTIINSFTAGLPYKYVLADFNGPPLANENGVTNLNISALVPSVNIRWLWDKIFEHYGWTYSGEEFNFEEWEDMWMNYPSALAYEEADTDLLAVMKTPNGNNYKAAQGDFYVSNAAETVQSPYSLAWIVRGGSWQAYWQYDNNQVDLEYGSLTGDGRYYTNKQSGMYKITWRINGGQNKTLGDWSAEEFKHEFPSYVMVGTTPIYSDPHMSFSDEPHSVVIPLAAGQRLSIGGFNDGHRTRVINTSFLKIERAGVTDVNFNSALIKFKVKDFFKEMMIRGALTAFPDVVNKNIHFVSLNERLDADIEDWSDKYVRRVRESYTYLSYAQNNFLKHKYDEELEDYHDGNLRVENRNLPVEATLYQSQTYAPEEMYVTWNGVGRPEYSVPSFKLYDLEIKKEGDVLIGDYKPLKERFYIFKDEWRQDVIRIIGTEVTGFPLANFSGMGFKEVVSEHYSRVAAMFSNTRIHEIELALTKYDVATLDLSKRYGIEQQGSLYLLNRLVWKNGKTSIGEFIKVR